MENGTARSSREISSILILAVYPTRIRRFRFAGDPRLKTNSLATIPGQGKLTKGIAFLSSLARLARSTKAKSLANDRSGIHIGYRGSRWFHRPILSLVLNSFLNGKTKASHFLRFAFEWRSKDVPIRRVYYSRCLIDARLSDFEITCDPLDYWFD